MKQFILRLVFRVTINGELQHFDEQLRLFYGENEQDVLDAANLAGETENQQFVSNSGGVIGWQFVAVTQLLAISDINQGALLFSESKFIDFPEGYSSYIAAKAIAITDKNLTFV